MSTLTPAEEKVLDTPAQTRALVEAGTTYPMPPKPVWAPGEPDLCEGRSAGTTVSATRRIRSPCRSGAGTGFSLTA